MTVKRKLFLSNAAIVFAALVMLFIVFCGLFKIVENTYLDRFDGFERVTVVDRYGNETVFENPSENADGTQRSESEWLSAYKKEIAVITVVFLAVGAGAIVLILLLSSAFTALMLRQIMKPVGILKSAAGRIANEDLTTSIDYTNNDEFKDVCDTFDDMQRHLKEGIEKNIAYEAARTTMVTDISHDLRTPLTSVKGYLKGVLDGVANTPEKQQMYIDIAYKKACSMDALLSKLFLFSKLETDNMPMYRTYTDLADYIGGYVEGMRPELAGRNAKISFRTSSDKLFSYIDREQMDRVFDNLTENSIKYNESPEITISLDAADGFNRILFCDNGSGVPQDELPHLFEQFYRVDKARNSEKEGNGLGLYIVKKITEAHGGSITARNNGGLELEIKLPAAKEEQEHEENSYS